MVSSISAIHLIEASPSLRETQKNLLCGPDAVIKETEEGYESVSKIMNVPIIWNEDIRLVPKGLLNDGLL